MHLKIWPKGVQFKPWDLISYLQGGTHLTSQAAGRGFSPVGLVKLRNGMSELINSFISGRAHSVTTVVFKISAENK